MATRTVTKVIVSCDRCGKDLLDAETESAALFATVQSARKVVADLAGECWDPWSMEQDGSALCPDCRPKYPEPECDGYIDTINGQCDDRWHDTLVALGGES